MQQINALSGSGWSYYGNVQTANGTGTIVTAGTNLNGIIIAHAFLKWVLTAVSSSIQARIGNTANGQALVHVFDDNGAGGVINNPSIERQNSFIFFPPGLALDWNLAVIAGSARVTCSVAYRVL